MDYDKMLKIQDQMEDEMEGACEYIDCAYAWMDIDRDWADMYYQLAKVEMTHMETLHTMAVKEIKKIQGSEEYEVMKRLYNYLHERMMKKAEKINRKISEY